MSSNNNNNNNNNGDSKVPPWLNSKLFEKILTNNLPNYKSINDFKAYAAMAPGENYATTMLRVEIKVELKGGNETQLVSFMLKVPQNCKVLDDFINENKIFDTEVDMYLQIIPEMEKLYRNAGLQVNFGAKCHQLDTEEKISYVLLDDLRQLGFKNVNRIEGLDKAHTECALKKLAQWHAASAVLNATKGPYAESMLRGYFNEDKMEFFQQMHNSMNKSFVDSLRQFESLKPFADKADQIVHSYMKNFYKLSTIDDNEFNVLNHGDLWSNNIMFCYNDKNEVKDTYFVDYQVPKYGSPAQDLLYFLLSSTQYEIKLKDFDYFIKFYHDNLIENLNVLKYNKKLPTLRDIHCQLIKYGLWGYSTVTGVMAAILMDPTDSANFNNFVSDTEAASEFRMRMYSSARYVKHIDALLPWLQNRGALDI